MRYIFVFLFFIAIECSSQTFTFFKEILVFNLDEKYFSLDGLYYFARENNNNTTSLPIFYPMTVKVDSNMQIDVYDLKHNKQIPFRIVNEGIVFNCSFFDSDTLVINVNYRYQHSDNKVEYILLSTHEWKKALEIANYKLYVHPGIKIKSISYTPDRLEEKNKQSVYTIEKINFMPDKNLILTFEK